MTAGPPSAPPGQPVPPPPPFPGIPPEVASVVTRGWGRGALAAGIVFALLFGASLVLSGIQHVSAPDAVEFGGERIQPPETSLADVPLTALSSVYLWHGVGFELDLGSPFPDAGPPVHFGASVSFALILGTLAASVLLFRAGRRVAGAHPGPAWLRPIHGLKVAAPYGLLSVALSPLARANELIPGLPSASPVDGAVDAGVSTIGALSMPFLVAAVAAGAGALGDQTSFPASLRRLRAALAGGWRMTWLAIALAVAGFLVVAAIHPDVTRRYLEFISQGGTLGIVRGALATAFLLGNVGVHVAAAAAGSPIGFSTTGRSCTLVSYVSFPSGQGAAEAAGPAFADPCAAVSFETGMAPLGYLLFLAVPAVATVLGGRLAARRAAAAGASDGLAIGAAAGAAHAVILTVLAGLAGISYEVDAGGFISIDGAAGAMLPATFFLALLWGAAGGAVGGWLVARSRPSPPEFRNVDGPGARPEPVDPWSG